jgi:hypothetical protein
MLDYNKIKNIALDNPIHSIEFRFNYKQHVNSHDYHTLMGYLNNNTIGKEELSTTYYSNMGIKKSVAGIIPIDTLFEKRTISEIYNKDYDIDIVIVSIASKKTIDNFTHMRDKIKHIYTFPIGNATYTIELSEITVGSKTYEIEVKYICDDFLRINKEDIDTLNAAIKDVLLILNQTKIVYTLDTKQKLLKDYTPFVRHCEFFTFDAIRVPSIQTIKAKGKKRSLIIHYTGIWLVKAPYEYNLIIEPVDNINNLLNTWSITVYEGELVEPIQRDAYNFNYDYWFLCNDCSYIRGKDITNDSYAVRFDYMKEFKNRISFFVDENYLTFGLQSQRYADNPDQFHQNCRDLLSLNDEVNYDTNGLIITPLYGIKKLKWMPDNEVYIDFITYHNKLYVIDNEKEVLFEGTKQYPFHGVDESFEITRDRQIVSCAFHNDLHCRVRLDKENGDTLENAISYWNYIHHPISIDTIKGDTTVIADNLIKNIFDQYASEHKGFIVNDLTSYWKDEESLSILVDYIDVELEPGDKFVFLTLDGDAIMHLFHDNTVSLEIGPVTIINNRDRTITINNNTDNTSYRYYLVHLMDLTQRLKSYNVTLVDLRHITDDKLLTTEGNIYASLYVYGYYIKK